MSDIVLRESNGRFLKGKPGGPGRPRGSRNRLTEVFLQDLLASWEKHGAEVIERLCQNDPATYLKIVASVVRAVRIEVDLNDSDDDAFRHVRTAEELFAVLRQRGGQRAVAAFKLLLNIGEEAADDDAQWKP
jgi:hypothetical protein